MKYLLAFLMIGSAHSAVLSQYISTVDGASEQTFELNKNSATYSKRSNYFDQKSSLELGTYTLTSFPKAESKALDEMLERIKITDDLLKIQKLSFNDLSEKKPHASFFFINDYRITEGSDFYPEVKAMFEKLQSSEMKKFTGLKLSSDYKEVEFFEGGISKSKEAFSFGFHCKDPQAPTYCLFKDKGILYIR